MFSFITGSKKKTKKDHATKAQAVIRGYITRRRYKIQRKRKLNACFAIQRHIRGYRTRSLLRKQKKYIVKVQAVFRGQSFRRRLSRADPIEIPISHFNEFRKKGRKRALHIFLRTVDHCGTGYLTLEDLYDMVTVYMPNPMSHETAKVFLSLIRSSLMKGSKNGLYSIKRIAKVILEYRIKSIPHQLRNTKFDKKSAALNGMRSGKEFKKRQIDMTAIPPYLVSLPSSPIISSSKEEEKGITVENLDEQKLEQQVNQQKQQTLPLLSIIPKTQASPESPDNVNNKNKKLPSPPKTNRSPKARQKTYIYTWQKVLSSDGVTYYYYNTFTQQSQWNPPARGIINTWKKDVANRAGYKIAKDRKSQITSPNISPKSPARKKANGVKIKVKSPKLKKIAAIQANSKKIINNNIAVPNEKYNVKQYVKPKEIRHLKITSSNKTNKGTKKIKSNQKKPIVKQRKNKKNNKVKNGVEEKVNPVNPALVTIPSDTNTHVDKIEDEKEKGEEIENEVTENSMKEIDNDDVIEEEIFKKAAAVIEEEEEEEDVIFKCRISFGFI